MAGIDPVDWRSVADVVSPFPDDVSAYVEKIMVDLARAEENDIKAALAAWSDVDGLGDPVNLLRIKYTNEPVGIRVDNDMSMFARQTTPKLKLEVPTLIVFADKRHTGTAWPGHHVPVDWRRHERTHTGERFTIALLHRDEAAKIPPGVRAPIAPITEYRTDTDEMS